MSTVDIDKGAENIAKLNKLGYPELDGACPTCGINPVTILTHHTTTLKAELLAKMPEPLNMKDYPAESECYNQAIAEITKLVENL
jgi:Fe-S cluster biogenesis protein NfuA